MARFSVRAFNARGIAQRHATTEMQHHRGDASWQGGRRNFRFRDQEEFQPARLSPFWHYRHGKGQRDMVCRIYEVAVI